MSKSNTLIKNTIIITIGKFCTKFLSFFLLPLYTAILTTEDFGIVDLFNTSVIFLIPLISLQIEAATFRYLIDARNSEKNEKIIISSSTYFLLVMTIVLCIIYSIIQSILPSEYKIYLLLNMIAVMWSGYLFQLVRGIGKTIYYTIGSFIVGTGTIIFNILFLVILRKGAMGMFASIFIANILGILYIILKIKLYRYVKFSLINKNSLKEMLRYSIPLIPNSFAWWAISVSDRLIVSRVLGVSANGVLSVSHKFPSLINTFYGLFHMAWTEHVTLYIDEDNGNEYITEIIIRVFKIFLAVLLGMLVLMPFIFPIIIKGDFSEAYKYIPIFCCATMFDVMAGLVDPIYTAKFKTKSLMSTTIVAGILNVFTHLVLIKYIGLFSAAFSSLVSYAFLVIYKYIDIQKYCRVRIPKRLICESLIMFFIVCYSYYLDNVFIHIVMMIIYVLYCIWINMDIAKIIIEILKNKGYGIKSIMKNVTN